MKKVITFLFTLSILISCNNSEIDNNYRSVLKQATKDNKYVLLDFFAIWCGGCKAYDTYIFNDSVIKGLLNEKYIVLKIDTDDHDNKFLVDKYKIIYGLPHIVLIDNQERILGSILGFKNKYFSNPEIFLTDIESIQALQIDIKNLETKYQSDTTNIEIINNLLEHYEKVWHHIKVEKLKNQLVNVDPTPQRLLEYNFNKAINSINNDKDPKPLLTLINENDSLNEKQILRGNSQLLYYYESIRDTINQDVYYNKMIEMDPDYFTTKYIRFLFEHQLKIDTAITLTKLFLEKNKNYLNDHWGQFLKAHSLVYQGESDKAVSDYSNWMINKKNRWESGDNYWPLYFYASFANFHNLDLERALGYIKIAEEKRHLTNDKLLKAEILYKLGQVQSSIDILLEVQNQVNEKNEYNRISKLIKKYRGELQPSS